MSTTTLSIVAEAKTTGQARADRRAAETAIGAALRPRLQREIDAVAEAGAHYREAKAASDNACAEVVRLCGTDTERKEIEDRARKAVPMPDELKGLRRNGVYIARMLVIESNGNVVKDSTWTEPPLVDWSSSYDIGRLLDDEPPKSKALKAFNEWASAKSKAWKDLYNDEQRAAIAASDTARHHKHLQHKQLSRAAMRLMRTPANTLEEIAAKVRAWADAHGILTADDKLATGQMDDFDNQFVLAVIGEDLLRGSRRVAR